MSLKVLTANRLIDGAVVYLTDLGAWGEVLTKARVADTKEAGEAMLAQGREAVGFRLIVGPYLADVARAADGTLRPVKMREVIRARGPSVRADLGKQAEGRGLPA
jgi:hypothetical protein